MNPLSGALNYLQGKSTVDNSTNPASAYSVMQRRIQGGNRQSAQSKALQNAMKKTFANPKGKIFGAIK